MPNNNGEPLRGYENAYYVIRFGDYYTGGRGIRGRIAELATINNGGSYTYEDGYVLGVPRRNSVYIFTDLNVSVLVNSLNIYDPQEDDLFVNFPFSILPDEGDVLTDNHYFDGKINEAGDNVYFALDPNWNSDDSDSSTPRVQIAQDQSDITRHESYFKKEQSPNYSYAGEIPDGLYDLMTYLGVENVSDIVFQPAIVYSGSKEDIILSFEGNVAPGGQKTIIVFNSHKENDTESGAYLFDAPEGFGTVPFDYSLTTATPDDYISQFPDVITVYYYISSELLLYLDGKAKMEQFYNPK